LYWPWPWLDAGLFRRKNHTFYLNPALEMLKAFLDTKQHGGYIKILPGNHGSFMTRELVESLCQEMAEQLPGGCLEYRKFQAAKREEVPANCGSIHDE
jgi:hypothetical protein